jgi:2-desacetyl-2-hydroxyethyl bacteriochlorophyllide A dehydrogenase
VRQIVLTKPGLLESREVPPVEPRREEALVKVRRVGVCGSDFHAFAGRHPVYSYPRVLGHEISAEVLALPENANELTIGQRCSVEPYVACKKCRPCLLGRTNCCENLRILGIHVDGGMSGLMRVPSYLLHKSDKLSLDQLALVEMLGIGAHAVARSGIKEGQEALVVGAGPIGLATIQFAIAAGATVSVVEKSAPRRDFVRQFSDRVFAEGENLLAEVVFDATGSAPAMAASVSHVAPAGRLVFVGLTREHVPINDALFHVREMTLLASRNSVGQFPRIIKMIEEGEIDTAPWINARVKLQDVPQAFEGLTKKPDLVKAIVEVGDEDL